MFIDTARISVKAGDGGNGAVSFHREKYVAAGGPDGGDGGRGGNVIIKVDDGKTTLMDFRFKTRYEAENGGDGRGARCAGKDGKPLVIAVPRGTVVKDKESGGIIADMTAQDELILAYGGRGGWGNARFATPTRQAPRFAKPGKQGEQANVVLELKLLADVGLIGFPNVGKSTLLSVISAARPKIADYHFTTLEPNLGIVSVGDVSFTVADIPGIIEGASGGAGLGLEFLRHIDRCRLLVHIVDVSGIEGRDPVEDYEQINSELFLYSEELAGRKQLVAANKADIAPDETAYKKLASHCADYGVAVFKISAATKAGVDKLLNRAAEELSRLPPIKVYEPDYVKPDKNLTDNEITIIRRGDGVFVVEGRALMQQLAMVDPNDYESLNFMQRVLRENGVFDMLEDRGIEEGDIVSLNNFEFEYVK